jgi:hypothetical protein
MRVGSYDYVPSCQTPEAAASQGPEWAMLIHLQEAPGARLTGGPGLYLGSMREPRGVDGW